MLHLLLALGGCGGHAGPPAVPSLRDVPTLDCAEVEGWCWERGRPLQIGGDRGLRTAWAAGPQGALFAWTSATGWFPLLVPTARTIRSAWIVDATEVWALDVEGEVWHLEDGDWTEVPPPRSVRRLLGRPDGRAYAIVGGGDVSSIALLEHDRGEWTEAAAFEGFCLGGDYALLPDDAIWTVALTCDDDGPPSGFEVYELDRTGATRVGQPVDAESWSVSFADVPGEIRVEGYGAWRWDGAAWQSLATPKIPQDLDLDESVFWDGLGYTVIDRSLDCTEGYRLDDTHVFCTRRGRLFSSRGDRWTPLEPAPPTQPPEAWGTMPPAVWAGQHTAVAWGDGPDLVFRRSPGADAALERFDGATWQRAGDAPVLDIDGASPDDVWFATRAGPQHFDGTRIVDRPLPDDDEPLLVRALGGGIALAATETRLYRYDEGWTQIWEAKGQWTIDAIAGSGSEDVWLLQGRIGRPRQTGVLRFDGADWSTVDVDLGEYASLFTDAAGVTWAASEKHAVRLDTLATTDALPDRLYGRLWVGPDEVWVHTGEQALRGPRP